MENILESKEVKLDGKITQFKNCQVLWKREIIRDDLWVRDGKILNPEKVFFDEKMQADTVVDCQNNIISPGYIELQINGAFGEDFSCASGTPDSIKKAVKKIAKGLLAHGVTSMCPTIITSPQENYAKIIPHIPRCSGSKEGAGVLGLHLEGPFINKEKKGAHPENLIRGFDNGFKDIEEYYGDLSSTSIVTIAPEHEASDDVITKLQERNITVSLGHSMANLSQGEQAVKSGATFITHLFNAMLPFHHRDPHLVGLLASNKIPDNTTVFFGIISDGIHTHPAALRIAHRTHPKGLVLVTDAVPSMGLPDGIHELGVQKVEVKSKRAVIAGTDILCGSIATMSECVQYFMNQTGCSQVEALECATLHPAQTLGITDKKGTLDYGSDADLIILDDQLNVLETYIAGELVWKKST